MSQDLWSIRILQNIGESLGLSRDESRFGMYRNIPKYVRQVHNPTFLLGKPGNESRFRIYRNTAKCMKAMHNLICLVGARWINIWELQEYCKMFKSVHNLTLYQGLARGLKFGAYRNIPKCWRERSVKSVPPPRAGKVGILNLSLLLELAG